MSKASIADAVKNAPSPIVRRVLEIRQELSRHKKVSALLGARIDDHTFAEPPSERGRLKQELLKANWPDEDLRAELASSEREQQRPAF